tara:strand:- start:3081 stop:4214 length:1134 start_codon:yes stop_codon:yes gene_type:complete
MAQENKECLKIVKDFYKDVLTVFPEYKDKLEDYEIEFLMEDKHGEKLYEYCLETFPQHFFNILYQNVDIFKENENLYFLPSINFVEIWKDKEISEKTRETIWKYLQLILFSVSKNVNSQESFGDTAKLFEAINEDELKKKLEETMKDMEGWFNSGEMFGDISMNNIMDPSNINLNDLPDAEDLQNHISGLLDGKLGRLAHEIAAETAEELNVDMEGATNVGEVFQKLFKNPGKLMNMVKNVGSKLDEKLKSGEIKESELMKEASELMEKMKNMPGMKNMDSLLSKMGIPGVSGAGKVNVNAMQARMKQNIRVASQKERMLRKLEQRRKERADAEARKKKQDQQYQHIVFTGDEPVEKSSRKPNKKRRKKKKKKKNSN